MSGVRAEQPRNTVNTALLVNARGGTHLAGAGLHTDSIRSARAAKLRYVSDTMPGIRRIPAGKGFRYIGPAGKALRRPDVLRRIRALAIPPAWTDVWVCPRSNGHLQASGRDAKGRKQYRYHPRWRLVRDESKYDRLLAFGSTLPRIRGRIRRDLGRPGLPRQKVLATVVRLLESTLIRVGNEEYARENGSFGLTTMRHRHVDVCRGTLHFEFHGKSGIRHVIDVHDRRLARIVRQCQDLPGQELFKYVDHDGKRHKISSDDVNEYLREVSGREFTAKDFRTWAGTVLAARALREFAAFDSEHQAKHNVVRAIDTVARRLGNTRAVCRKCYVHPALIDTYLDGCLHAQPANGGSKQTSSRISHEEASVLRFMRQRLRKDTRQASGRASEKTQSGGQA